MQFCWYGVFVVHSHGRATSKRVAKACCPQMPFVHRNMQDAIVSARYVVKLLMLEPWDPTMIEELK